MRNRWCCTLMCNLRFPSGRGSRSAWITSMKSEARAISRLVQDNLNTHTPAALYETFPPAEARRILQRLEFHYTPKHSSWLNMAEIEIAILERNALSRRLEDEETLRRRVLGFVVLLDRNDDIALFVPCFDIPVSLDHLFQRIAPVYDWF